MEELISSLRRLLVDHPAVAGFEWSEGRTWGSSPKFVAASVVSYLSVVFLLRRVALVPLSQGTFRLVSAAHNFLILVLSLAMAIGCFLSSLSQMPDPNWLFCFPARSTPPKGPVFFWAYAYFLSKLLEFSDTLIIFLNQARRSPSFLHVYHHSLVVVMSYLWLRCSQSLLPIALVTNTSVHTLMYSYYLLCSLGIRPRWKRAVTDCQIAQFLFSLAASLVFLWLHFRGGGCSGFGAWVFNAVFNVSLLVLFLDFHSKNYGRQKGACSGKEIKERRD